MGHVVILGHAGFIGSALRERLPAAGHDVCGVSSAECDLTDLDSVRRLARGLPPATRVVFCAAVTRLREDSYRAFCRNTAMASNFVEAAPRGTLAGLVYLSTADVYGALPPLPITEQTLPAPVSYYGIARLAGEHLVRRPGALDCPVAVLRLSGVYGPTDRGRSVLGRFLVQLREKGGITIYGDGDQRRDWIHVGDLCEVVRQVLERPFDGLLNVATGTSVSLKQLAGLLAQATGLPLRIEHRPAEPAAAGDLQFDVRALRAWLPALSFKGLTEGVREYVAAFAG